MINIAGKIAYGLFVTLLMGVAGLLLVSLLPITGNVEIKIVKSGSMEPAISTGSLVVVMPSRRYVAGDVITFGKDTTRDIPTTHRIVSVRENVAGNFYQTKGDANEEADPREIAHKEIIGKVLFHVPYAGYVLDFARQPVGFVLLIGLPATMIVIDELVTMYNEIRNMRRRKISRLNLDNEYQGLTLIDMPVPQKPRFCNERHRIPTI